MPGHKSDYTTRYTMEFNADVSQAKKELQDLQQQLNSLGTLSNPKVGNKLTSEIQEASQAAAKLKIALDSAIDVDTGKLNLSKFSRALKQSGMSLSQYRDQLVNMGPEGEKAFTQIANSVLKAEAPLRRSSKLIDTMWTTLKNTARWEISSAILHGLESSLTKAVSYAQDLNKSLTDIRIVTGYDADRMASFAVEANKAAKALSATTTEYTNASLIYYQQGLSDQAVKERTDITIKMANVTRQSAETISDQMTAVWNNFDDGSKSLEYYADVLTALGAATASSTDEIVQGLEKFAAVADTVGLSYEYATAALATITSNTRQSADVVGTALKTLFARIQGLNLGETLEDGTDFNKYSEALNKVGISVKEQNGELKAMDDILDEMAAKWDTLNSDQQVALAQTVAGVRQYTQLIALMENWDGTDEDNMMANLRTASNASGALQGQADIYAESWEAASDRVQAALESIFNKLLKDEFFIETLNNIEKIITGIDKFIESIGGLKGVLTGLGAIATKVFAGQMSSGLSNLAYNLNFGAVKERDKQMRIDAANAESDMLATSVGNHGAQSDIYKRIGKLQVLMIEKANQMSDIEKEQANYSIERLKILAKQTEKMERQAEIAEKIAQQTKNETTDISQIYHETEEAVNADYEVRLDATNKDIRNSKGKKKKKLINERNQLINERDIKLIEAKKEDFNINQLNFLETRENLENSINKRNNFQIDNQLILKKEQEKAQILEKQKSSLEKGSDEYNKVTKELKNTRTKITKLKNKQEALNKEVDNAKEEYAKYVGEIKANSDADIFNDADLKEKLALETPEQLKKAGDETEEQIKRAKGNMKSLEDGIVSAANSIISLSFGIQALGNIWDTWKNPDMTGWEKFTSTLTTLSFAIPSLIGGISSLVSTIEIFKKANISSLPGLAAYALGLDLSTAKTEEETKALVINALAKKTGIVITAATTKEEVLAAAAKSGHTVATTLLAAAQAFLNGQLALGLSLIAPYIIAIAGLTAAIFGLKAVYDYIQESSPEGQLKKLTEEAEASAEAANQAEEAYNNLKATIESYDTALEKIEGLTKGTEEFKLAIEDANKKAEELIDNYNILDGVYLDENGVIRFKEGTFEGKVSEAEEAKRGAAINAYSDQQKVTEQQYEVDMINTTKELLSDLGQRSFDSYTIEEVANNLQEILDATAEKDTLTGEKIAEILGREYQPDSNFGKWVDTLATNLENNDTAITLAQASINKNIDALNSNTNALISGSNLYSGEKWYQDSEYKNVIAIEGTKYSNEQQQKYYDEAKKGKDSEGNVIDLDKHLKEQMGYIYSGGEWIDPITGESKKLTAEDKYSLYAGDMAQKDAIAYGKELNSKLSKINPIFAAGIEAFYGGQELTFEQAKALQIGYDNDGFISEAPLMNQTSPEKAKEFGQWITDLNPYQSLDNKFIEDNNGYRNGLQRAHNWYDNLSSEDRNFTQGIDYSKNNWDEQLNILKDNAILPNLKTEVEKLNLDTESWEILIDQLSLLPEHINKTKSELGELAKTQLRASRGAKEFGENLDDWGKILTDNNLEQKVEALKKIEPAFKDIFNLSDEDFQLLPEDFIEKNWEDLEKGLKGSDTHLKKIAQNIGKITTSEMDKAGRDIVSKTADFFAEGIFWGIEDFQKNLDIINTFHDELAALNDLDIDTQIKVVGSEEFINKCNQMVSAAGWTAEQTQEYFKSMGYDVKIVEGKKPASTEEEIIQWAPLDPDATLEAGTPQFKETKEIKLTHTMPERSAFSIESITPDGSTGGNVDYIQKQFNSSGGGSSKNGGGGGSSSKKEPLKAKNEIERYHENTRAIERLSRALDKVSKAKDRAFGKERLRLIDQEIASTERLVAQQRAYIAEAKKYLQEDFSAIQKYGFTFDQYGELTNYDEIMMSQINKVNAAISSGNEEAIETAEKEYEEFKENMGQYEETLNLYEEAQAQLQDYINQVVDLKLEKITTEVEVKIRVNDIELTKLEYLLKKVEFEGRGAAEAIGLIGKQFEQVNEKAKPIQEAIDKIYQQARAEGRGFTDEEIAEAQSLYRGGLTPDEERRLQEIHQKVIDDDRALTQAEEDQILEYKEQLLELNETVMDYVETVESKFLETFDELNSAVDESIGRFATYTGMFETLENVITLTGKANTKYGKDLLSQFSARTVANASAAMRSNILAYNNLNKQYEDQKARLAQAIQEGDERFIKTQQEWLDHIEQTRETAYNSMLSSWNDVLQASSDLFDTKLDEMIYNLKQNLGDIDSLVEIYDRAVELENLYLSGTQSIYELGKLVRDIGKSIDATSNIIAKNKLADLLEDINKLRAEGVKLSQYDLEYWQAKYELELAEIALQEAQDAKSQVKLTRNSAGGWGYVYTADAEAVAKAEQGYEDALYNMQSLNEKYIADYSERILQNEKELVEALQGLDKNSAHYEEDLMRTRDFYFKQQEYLMNELNKVYERSGIGFKDTVLGQVSDQATLGEHYNNFVNSVSAMIQDELIPEYNAWKNSVANANNEMGQSLEDFMNDISDTSETLEDTVISKIDEMGITVTEVADKIWDFQESYSKAIQQMIKANEEFFDKTAKDYNNFISQTAIGEYLKNQEAFMSAGDVLGLTGQGGAIAASTAGLGIIGDTSLKLQALSSSPSGPSPSNPKRNYEFNKKQKFKKELIKDRADLWELDKELEEAYRRRSVTVKGGAPAGSTTYYTLFDTGGYTGSWGGNGRLAVLHEKELVLNKYDTENMLDMVNTLRDIDWRAKLAGLWGDIEKTIVEPALGGNDTLDQNVHIEASFPNVSDHNEIEEAFNNLINTASQFANRKIY